MAGRKKWTGAYLQVDKATKQARHNFRVKGVEFNFGYSYLRVEGERRAWGRRGLTLKSKVDILNLHLWSLIIKDDISLLHFCKSKHFTETNIKALSRSSFKYFHNSQIHECWIPDSQPWFELFRGSGGRRGNIFKVPMIPDFIRDHFISHTVTKVMMIIGCMCNICICSSIDYQLDN